MRTSRTISTFLLTAAFLATSAAATAQIAAPPVPPPPTLEQEVTPDPSGAEATLGGVDNQPPLEWYTGPMVDEIEAMAGATQSLKSWAEEQYGGDYENHREYYELAYFADWLHSYLQDFREKTYYTESGSQQVTERYFDGYEWQTRTYQLDYDDRTPRWFNDHGYYATRGDHNNFLYNYVRPVYHWVLQGCAAVKEKYGHDAQSNYHRLASDLVESYKRYTRVNYGQSGGDPSAPIDIEDYIVEAEHAAVPTEYASAPLPSRSSSIAMTSDDTRIAVVNRQKNSVTVIRVKDEYGDSYEVLSEIPVGREPRYVAITPDDRRAFVSNTLDGTVSVVDLAASPPRLVGSPIRVGSEPRGLALTPTGNYLYVANHTDGTVSVIRTSDYQVVNTVAVGESPISIAISNDGDAEDADESVFVNRFFSEVIDPENRPDGFNDSKQGIVVQLGVSSSLGASPALSRIVLSPIADSGFTADRRQFCRNTRDILQAQGEVVFFNSGVDGNGDGAAALANETFCPDIYSYDASPTGPIANAPQGAYPNQLYSSLLRNGRLFVPNVGASPEPPVQFATNVQALVSNVDIATGQEIVTNLNDQIKTEPQPATGSASLARLFGNDVVAVDADASGRDFLFVSRGGNYVLRAQLDDDGKLDIGAPNQVVRFKTGNIPSGVVMSRDGRRAYTNNEVSTSVTAIDLERNQVLAQDLSSSSPPAPGSQAHRNLVGKLAFFTALGIPDDLSEYGGGAFDIGIRDIDPIEFRGKASNNAWSACTSCHEDGHSDNVTWIFPTGPRQSIALEGTFANGNIEDQRILNWNAVRGSVTDFDLNSRGVQGGIGHATNAGGRNRSGEIFNHGPTGGVSDALDAMTEWVALAVRAPVMAPVGSAAQEQQGRSVFQAYCASCHGGAKWTKSTIAGYDNDPTFAANPLGANFFAALGEPPLDPRLIVAGPQIRSLVEGWQQIDFLDAVGTFDAAGPIEIRGAGALGGGIISIYGDPNEGVEVAAQSTQGFPALGNIGFNSPSLLGVGYHAPYLHDGSAVSLRDVFAKHRLPAAGDQTIAQAIYDEYALQSLDAFLRSIDDQTEPFELGASAVGPIELP